jgi:hypothetical protein
LRCAGAAFDQTPDSNASRAAATARSTSRSLQRATSASTLPDAGLSVANVSPDAAALRSPAMNARPSSDNAFAFCFQS